VLAVIYMYILEIQSYSMPSNMNRYNIYIYMNVNELLYFSMRHYMMYELHTDDLI